MMLGRIVKFYRPLNKEWIGTSRADSVVGSDEEGKESD